MLKEIKLAFDTVPYPKGLLIAHDCEECRELERVFTGKQWQLIEDKVIEDNFSNLPLFSAEAFHYFLPAYLGYSLCNFSNSNWVCEFAIYSLTPSNGDVEDKNQLEFWRWHFASFNKQQMSCIYDFLDLVVADMSFDYHHNEVQKGRRNLAELVDPNRNNIYAIRDKRKI